MRGAFLLFPVLLVACLDLLPQGGDGSGTESGAQTGADGAPAVTGVDCIVEETSGETICSGMSSCPGLLVDHDNFPTCGFRPAAGVLDLECICANSVCPIGVATTCEAAQKLLAGGQTQLSVCNQEYEGRCTPKKGSSTGPKKICDEDCLIRCVDDGCPKRCGCAN